MNSKEALENYHSMACYHSVIVDDTRHYETIKKDLEILEYLEKENLDFYYRTEKAVIDKEFFKKLFANAVSIAEKYDIPLYCGEYGVIDRAPLDDTLSWFSAMHEAFEESGIPRAVWTYKAKDFGLVDEHYAKIKDKLIELL